MNAGAHREKNKQFGIIESFGLPGNDFLYLSDGGKVQLLPNQTNSLESRMSGESLHGVGGPRSSIFKLSF